jgi:hypothetical protein
MRARVLLPAAFAVLLGDGFAIAQETGHSGGPSADPVTVDVTQPPDNIVDFRMRRSWDEGVARRFLSATIDVGYLYLRPRASFGYGRPFDNWVGIDLNPVAAGNGLGFYGGFRVAIQRVDLRLGPRFFGAFYHRFLEPRESYSRLDLDSTVGGDKARYVTFEGEVNVSIPAGPGNIIALGSLSYLVGVPEGQLVFEETLRVIVAPPLVWRARGGYEFRLGTYNQHSLGLVADALDVPARDDSRTFRAGPVLRIALSRHFEVRGTFVVTLISPDALGLVGSDFTELGVRYRWATE